MLSILEVKFNIEKTPHVGSWIEIPTLDGKSRLLEEPSEIFGERILQVYVHCNNLGNELQLHMKRQPVLDGSTTISVVNR